MRVALDGFSLVEGGPLYWLARRAGCPGGARGLVILGIGLALLTWLPLAVLSALDHARLGGAAVSLIESLGTHTRSLVVIPLFFLAEVWFGAATRDALRHALDSNLVKVEELPRLSRAVGMVIRWRDAWIAEVALAVFTVAAILSGASLDLPPDISTWRASGSGPTQHLTLAGWWYLLVTIPIFQFLLWRWCWRLLIWYVFLARFARLDLQLIPTHPDCAGGLGGFGVAHTALSALAFAGSALVAASYAEEILFRGVPPKNLVLPIVGLVVACVVTLFGPLVLFMPKLVSTKERGLFEYGELAAAYTRAFDRKWLRGAAPADEPLLGSADIQSLADMWSSYSAVREMGFLPISRYQIVLIAVAAILPLTPLALTVYPLDELVLKSAKSFVGL